MLATAAPKPDAAQVRRAVEALRAEVAAMSWFAAVGLPPTDAETAETTAFLAAMDRPDLAVGWIADWRDAERATRDPEGAGWWQADRALQDDLVAGLGLMMRDPDFLEVLNGLALAASDAAMAGAAVAAARDGVADQALIRVAAGAAGQAAEQAALARAAGGGSDHPFALQLRLFAGGRWPIGPSRGRFAIL